MNCSVAGLVASVARFAVLRRELPVDAMAALTCAPTVVPAALVLDLVRLWSVPSPFPVSSVLSLVAVSDSSFRFDIGTVWKSQASQGSRWRKRMLMMTSTEEMLHN